MGDNNIIKEITKCSWQRSVVLVTRWRPSFKMFRIPSRRMKMSENLITKKKSNFNSKRDSGGYYCRKPEKTLNLK